MLRIPHYLDNRLKDGGKAFSPTHRPHFTPRKHYFYVSGTHSWKKFISALSSVNDIHDGYILWNVSFNHHHHIDSNSSVYLHIIHFNIILSSTFKSPMWYVTEFSKQEYIIFFFSYFINIPYK
jgi:hypothetical protein